MKCEYCGVDLPEKDIQLSHDVPKYMGGLDSDGRHYLCKKHHDIYEKLAFAVAFKYVPEDIKKPMNFYGQENEKK